MHLKPTIIIFLKSTLSACFKFKLHLIEPIFHNVTRTQNWKVILVVGWDAILITQNITTHSMQIYKWILPKLRNDIFFWRLCSVTRDWTNETGIIQNTTRKNKRTVIITQRNHLGKMKKMFSLWLNLSKKGKILRDYIFTYSYKIFFSDVTIHQNIPDSIRKTFLYWKWRSNPKNKDNPKFSQIILRYSGAGWIIVWYGFACHNTCEAILASRSVLNVTMAARKDGRFSSISWDIRSSWRFWNPK